MKVVFISNYYTHHQAPFSEVMHRLTNGRYYFIATQKMTEERIRLGWGNIGLPDFVLNLNDSDEQYNKCHQLITDADVVMYSTGNAPYSIIKERVKQHKLTFVYSERIYRTKRDERKLLYHAVKYQYMYGIRKSIHLLCPGAYVSYDYSRIGCFKNKAYKWGYFTSFKPYESEDVLMGMKMPSEGELGLKHADVSILWVARLIGLKHPELAVEVGKRLKEAGVSFQLNMIGVGDQQTQIEKLIEQYDLSDNVHLLGSMTPEDVRVHMEKSQIFLFTSDKNEGWGAVLNEAMNSGCAVVANEAIGSVRYLINDGVNGLQYNDEEPNDLYGKILTLVNDKQKIDYLGRNAYKTIKEEWNPKIAAERFLTLSEYLLSGKKGTPFTDNVCSKAEIIKG